jgi:hypothetical protein
MSINNVSEKELFYKKGIARFPAKNYNTGKGSNTETGRWADREQGKPRVTGVSGES